MGKKLWKISGTSDEITEEQLLRRMGCIPDDLQREYIKLEEQYELLKRERLRLEQDKEEYREEYRSFEQEVEDLKRANNALKAARAEFENEKIAFQYEKNSFEHKKIDFEQEKIDFEQEKRRVKELENQSLRKIEEYNKLISDIQSQREAEFAKWKSELDQTADQQYNAILKDKLSGYFQNEREEWNKRHESFDQDRVAMAEELSQAKREACDKANELQRELGLHLDEVQDKMKEYLNDYMVNFSANMDRWRSSVYNIQLGDFAAWYVKFCKQVNNFDVRLASNPEDTPYDKLVMLGQTLGNLRISLERALPYMGLRSYYPKAGDDFDFDYHEAEDADIDTVAKIKSCEKPGVEFVSKDKDLSNVLIKAVVTLENEVEE